MREYVWYRSGHALTAHEVGILSRFVAKHADAFSQMDGDFPVLADGRSKN